ncbi:hypothetical protein BW732_04515 [Vagococcus penaei]|uniref:PRD domain-containing protein n=1 Tax=Vagococcus penaei TaxID=633807 RepID=A0A1Q2D935_9ENTE|nr:hypothetical protein BW732_04515 [Vagococcus penaei]
MYSTVKSLNNNLVLAVDDKNDELVLFGKGIGFKKKEGDIVEEKLVQKIFYAKSFKQDLSELFADILPEVLATTEKIIELGEKSLNKQLNHSLLIALSDHLQTAIKRVEANEQAIESTLQWEIPFLYVRESEVGRQALMIVKEDLGVTLPPIEASFIALHFVNAQDDLESMEDTMLITAITKEMVKLIQSLFDVSLNKESASYARFVTHIRYFMNRHLHHQQYVSNDKDTKLYHIIKEQYPRSYACSLVIREMLVANYQLTVSNEELIYLVIHIERVVSESTIK